LCRCASTDPQDRPNFDQIVEDLKALKVDPKAEKELLAEDKGPVVTTNPPADGTDESSATSSTDSDDGPPLISQTKIMRTGADGKVVAWSPDDPAAGAKGGKGDKPPGRVELQEYADDTERIVTEITKKFGAKNVISAVTAVTQKGGWRSEETVEVEVNVDNNSSQTIKTIRIHLESKWEGKGKRKPFVSKSKSQEYVQAGIPILHNSKFQASLSFPLPKRMSPPPKGYDTVSYDIVVGFVIKKLLRNLVISAVLPINYTPK